MPPGHATFFEATREWALVTDRLKEPMRSATILVSVGQSTTPNAPKLKQDMWRAELLGRGEAYDAASAIYRAVRERSQDVTEALNQGTPTQSVEARRAMWLMPNNGEQYETLTKTLKALETELDTLGVAMQALETQGRTLSTSTSPRKDDLDKLTHRLNDIRSGITAKHLDSELKIRLAALEKRISHLRSQDRILLRHHQEILPKQMRTLRPMILSAVEDMSAARTAHHELDRSINSATNALLATLATQTGLGDLNLLIWRKEAASRAREKAIEDKRQLIKWIESDDPAQAPRIR